MNSCEKVRLLLPLSAGGDLDDTELRQIKAHVAECPRCLSEEQEYSQVINLARSQVIVEYGLPDAVRGRLAREVAERALRYSLMPLSSFMLTARPGLLATAAAVLLALVALPLAMRDRLAPSGGTEITRIEVVNEGGEVRLAWSDGAKASYTVYKSSDPRDISRGEVHVVRGNVWTDHVSDSSPIVFYRVE